MSDLDDPLFLPYILEAELPVPDDFEYSMISNKNGYVEFEFNGVVLSRLVKTMNTIKIDYFRHIHIII